MYKFESELALELVNAQIDIPTGDFYMHYKNQEIYQVIGHVIIEATSEVGVTYRAQYGEYLTFVRPASNWVEKVEYEGKLVDRFQKVYPNELSGLSG